jgi:hypothetical protein
MLINHSKQLFGSFYAFLSYFKRFFRNFVKINSILVDFLLIKRVFERVGVFHFFVPPFILTYDPLWFHDVLKEKRFTNDFCPTTFAEGDFSPKDHLPAVVND